MTDISYTLKRMDVPTWGINCTLVNYDTSFNNDDKVVNDIRTATDMGKWIGICSPIPGRGKTHLAIGAMGRSWFSHIKSTWERTKPYHEDNTVCTDQFDCSKKHSYRKETYIERYEEDDYFFTRADIMLDELAMAGISLKEGFKFYSTKRCLLLDEIGRNTMNKNKLELLQTVIYEIYDQQRQLIFTSPFTIKTLSGILDGSILDRMNEGLIIELPKGNSYRHNGQPS